MEKKGTATKARPEKKEKPSASKDQPGNGEAPATPDAPVDPPAPTATTKVRYLINARYDHPPFGGIPMPPGICFYGFATTKLTESKAGQGISEKQALAAVRKSLDKDVDGLVIESVSALPKKW